MIAVTFLIWFTIGIAYPLYFAFITSYLQANSTYTTDSSLSYTYKIYCIVSAVGVLGPVAAGFAVETRLGRRWMMAISAVLTGVFLFAYTAVRSEASDIGFQVRSLVPNTSSEILTSYEVCYRNSRKFRIRYHVCFQP